MRLISFFVLLFSIKSIYCQTLDNTGRFNEKNLYYDALTRYLSSSYWKEDGMADSIFIKDDSKLTDSILPKYGRTKFIKLREKQIFDYLANHSVLTLYWIFPLDYENLMFSISIIPFVVTRKKRRINYGNGGGFKIFYHIENGNFRFEKIVGYGI